MAEEEVKTEEEETINPLSVSDDDIDNMVLPPEEEIQEEELKEEEETEEETQEPNKEETEEKEEEETTDTEDKSQDNVFSDTKDTDTSDDNEEDTEQKATKEEDTETKETETSDIDFEAEYKKILAPFRANGRDIQVASIEDARKLMQMGANYNKKMAGLKPNLRLLKLLENNDLLDEGKLGYLIDLDKKNPEAVKKLLKDSGLDPLDIDTDKDSDYKPSTYTVNDKELELDAVLDEIRDTDSFQTTLDIVSTKWDEASRQALLENPKAIKAINDQVAVGIFDQITSIVESERMLGRMTELSDLQAYKKVGEYLQKNNGFIQKETTTTTANSQPDKRKEDPKLKSRRKAASSTKAAPSKKKVVEDYNPLSLSDEDFEKIASSQYM